jgi:hypothetical protein
LRRLFFVFFQNPASWVVMGNILFCGHSNAQASFLQAPNNYAVLYAFYPPLAYCIKRERLFVARIS